MHKEQPIGIFDSGVGGTSIWKEIVTLMPNESTCYLADSKYAPYGNKAPERITALCIKNTEALLNLGAKIIVVACNTATTSAIAHLRDLYDVPFIGIEPAIKPAALASKTGAIGILATQGTLSSDLFAETSRRFTAHLNVIEVVGEGLVPIIEAGNLESDALEALVKQYLQPMIAARVDYLVLGCSHYPYLVPLLKKLLPTNVRIIDSEEDVARQTQAVLHMNGLLRASETTAVSHQLFSNTNTDTLEQLLKGVPTHKTFGYLDF